MGYKPHAPLSPRLIGFDPVLDLPEDHLARFVDYVVDSYVAVQLKDGPGQPAYDRRMGLKVLLYSYATGVRSSRRMEQNCRESLPYLLLVRDDRPSYRSLCTIRLQSKELLASLWVHMNGLAAECGMAHMGKIAVDSSKFRAGVSRDSVVARKERQKIIEGFARILEEAEAADAKEDEEGSSLQTQTGVPVSQMREVLRRIRTEKTENIAPSPKLLGRIKKGLKTLESAKDQDLSHVSLSDPDARMMAIGSSKKIAMGHSFEAVADNGLIVVGQTHNSPTDNDRLGVLVSLAKKADPEPITQVLADSGYFAGAIVNELLKDEALDLVVPDSTTACAMRKPPTPDPDPIVFKPVEGGNCLICPQGNLLKPAKHYESGGQRFSVYRAESSCVDCPLASRCLKNADAQRRNLTVGEFSEALKAHLARFEAPETRKAYYARGPAIETVFSILRNILRFERWSLRGAEKVQTEGSIIKTAYQLRKLHTGWTAQLRTA